MNDYDNLVRSYELPLPPGYSNIEEFNVCLARALDPLHIAKRHPSGQTLRGGSQVTCSQGQSGRSRSLSRA